MASGAFWTDASRAAGAPLALRAAGRGARASVQNLFATAYLSHRQFAWDDWDAPGTPWLTLLAYAGPNRLQGVMVLQLEARPVTLPPGAPNRICCRGVAVAKGGTSARDVPALLARAGHFLRQRGLEGRLRLMTDRPWLRQAAVRVGFRPVDSMRYLQRSLRLTRRAEPAVPVREAVSADFPLLAARDAALFEPLWHMGEAELRAQARRGCLLVARRAGAIAGYVLCAPPPPAAGWETAYGFIERLAVWPEYQGQRLGSRLLTFALARFRAQGLDCVQLNALASALQAQRFYAQHGFRPLGRPHCVLAQDLQDLDARCAAQEE